MKQNSTNNFSQVEFLQTAVELAANFVGITRDADLDQAVNTALKRLGLFFDVDRAYLFIFSADLAYMTNTHEWCARGVKSQKQRIQKHATDAMPWWKNSITRRKPVHIPDVDALSDDARPEQTEFRAQGIRSLLCLPIIADADELIGFMGFDAVRRAHFWADDQITMLQLIAEILAKALKNHRTWRNIRVRRR